MKFSRIFTRIETSARDSAFTKHVETLTPPITCGRLGVRYVKGLSNIRFHRVYTKRRVPVHPDPPSACEALCLRAGDRCGYLPDCHRPVLGLVALQLGVHVLERSSLE